MAEQAGRFASAKESDGMPDVALVKDAADGSGEAFGALVRRYWRLAAATAVARVGDAAVAEEIAQGAFLTAFQRLEQLRQPERFAAWLLKIVARSASRAAKRRKQQPATLTADRVSSWPISDVESSPTGRILAAERKQMVWGAIRRLRAADRTLVLLRYFEGLSHCAISEKTGRTEGAVRVRLHRILDRLESQLKTYFLEG